MRKYGIAYMGSKDGVADEIAKIFPKAENFYDVFGGGFSITHAMLKKRANHFKTFHFNEIKSDIVDLIKKAISEPVSISEYNIKDKRFFVVKALYKRSMLAADKKNNCKNKVEKIYINRAGRDKFIRNKNHAA